MNQDPKDKEPEVARVPFEKVFPRFKLPEIPGPLEITDAPELYDPEFEEPSKPVAKLLKLIAALIIFSVTMLWTVSEDVINEKLKPFISSFIDLVIAKYALNDDNADHSHNNPIEVTGTVEASKDSKGVSAHDNDPDK